MFIVGIDRPYYPLVEYFNSKVEAFEYFISLIRKEKEEDGLHTSKVFMSKILKFQKIKTSY